MSELNLYSTALCPYAHRCRLALSEKGVRFNLIEIDLQNKPTNFREISPLGKVPVLQHGDRRIWESTIINEYLEEAFPVPPLFPKDPMQRAQARMWIHFADTQLFATTHNLLLSQDLQQQAEAMKKLTEFLRFIEYEGLQKLSADEPYWLGTEVSLVDLTYYPWFEQVAVLEHFRGFQIPTGLDRLKKWWETVANRDAVQASSKSKAFYLEQYAQLSQRLAAPS